jgi:two-component system, response regulator YesN
VVRATYSVVVAEDEKLIRDNLVEKIQGCDPSFAVVGAASDGAQALEILRSRQVDVLFTDIRMPVMDGLELARHVRSELPRVQVVVVSGYADFTYAQHAIHLGVEEYLLKPIRLGLLAEVLRELKTKLAAADSQELIHAVRDAINGRPGQTRPVSEQAYMAFLLNIGNLCSTTASPATRSTYDALWRRFDFDAFQAHYPGGVQVDAPQPNVRYLVLPVPQAADRGAIGLALYDALLRQAAGVSIHLLYGPASGLEALHIQARALHRALVRRLIMDASNLIDVERFAPEPPAAVLDPATEHKLTALICQDQTRLVKLEVQRLIETALTLKRSQTWLQDLIQQLIRLFQRHSPCASEVEIDHAEYELFDKLALPRSSATLGEQVWTTLQPLLRDTSREVTASKELIDAIRSYITVSFNTDLTLEDIACRFGFTPSHLIKVFRKHVGQTPIQYLINLRLVEAKRLLAANPELDIKQIGEMVGYADPHYFSRIFKHVNGVTPTEYRTRSSSRLSK